jgi:hypothetical protein
MQTNAADFITDEPFLQKVVDKYTERNGLPHDGAAALAACGGSVFAGTSQGLHRLTGKVWGPVFRNVIDFPVTALSCRDKLLLASGPGGLVSVDMNTGYNKTMLAEPVYSAVNSHGHFFVATQTEIIHISPDGGIFDIQKTNSNSALAAYAGTLYFSDGKSLFSFAVESEKIQKAALPDTVANAEIRKLNIDADKLYAATDMGIAIMDLNDASWHVLKGEIGGLPYEDVTSVDALGDVILAGFSIGAARYNGSEWHYFESGRYFPDDRVNDVLLAEDGTAWIATRGGITRIAYEPMTLAQKAAYYQKRIPLFNRMGFVGDASLAVQGDMDSLYLKSHDNENVWTGMYVAAECFRYKVTGESQALEAARASVDALLRLETIAGGNGYFARSFARVDVDENRTSGGEWRPAADPEWWWKSDTSSDELVGRFFGFSVYHDLCASAPEKQAIAASAGRTMRHIIDNDYYLIDVDGQPTTWGRWNPDFFKTDGKFQKNLNSLEILSALRTAYALTGDEIFYDHYKKLIKEHGYANNTVRSKINQPGMMNHSDDLLHFLSYYPLLKYENVDMLLEKYYYPGIRRTWSLVKKEKNPLWNFIYGAVMPEGEEFDAGGAAWLLRRMPLEVIYWPVKNSHRMDIEFDPYNGPRPDEKQSLNVLPPDERFMLKFNENPFRLDGYWNGDNAEPPSFWLLPYWMGRYYGFIREPVVMK